MTNIAQAAAAAARRLAAAGIGRAGAESALLLEQVTGYNWPRQLARDQEVLSAEAAARLEDYVSRRIAGEPMAYILGWRDFYDLRFRVNPDVLIPRPETELLVEKTLEELKRHQDCAEPLRMLELGVGSGCVTVCCARHAGRRIRLFGGDISTKALAVASENAARYAVEADLRESSWFSAFAGMRFDVIVSNPPYICEGDPHLQQSGLPYEPQAALVAGADGLKAIRAISVSAPDYLRPGGALLLEHGWDQGAAVRELLMQAGLTGIRTFLDLGQRERVSMARAHD